MTLFYFDIWSWLPPFTLNLLRYMEILQVPPPAVLPPGSVSLKEAAETQFSINSSTGLPGQVCQIKYNLAPHNLG